MTLSRLPGSCISPETALAVDTAFGRIWFDGLGFLLTAAGISLTDALPEAKEMLCTLAIQHLPQGIAVAWGDHWTLAGTTILPSEALFFTLVLEGDSRARFITRIGLTYEILEQMRNSGQWVAAPEVRASGFVSDIHLRVECEVGRSTLHATTVKALRPGDAILVQQHNAVEGGLLVACGGRYLLLKGLDRGSRFLVFDGWHDMENANLDQPIPSASLVPEGADIDNLPISLSFVAGHLTVTVGSLKHLSVGDLLSLDRPPSCDVALRIGDQTIGYGELVEIDGRLAVEILRMAGNESGS
jgi:type III secretion protein Q